MGSKVNYTLVGFFVLLLGSAFVATTLWLSAAGQNQQYTTYIAYLSESVSGLNPKSAVKYRGVDVGLVRDIDLDRDNPERVMLLLDIEAGTPIKTDTVATLSVQGITGLAFVELTGGSREAPLLAASRGAEFPEIPTEPSLFVRLDTAVTEVVVDFGSIADSFNRTAMQISSFLNDDNQAALAGALQNTEDLTRGLAGRAKDLGITLAKVNRVLDGAGEVTDELPTLVRRIEGSLAALEGGIRDIRLIAGNMDTAVTSGREEMLRLSRDTLAPLGPLLAEMRQLVQTLNRIGAQIEQKPNLLLLGRPASAPGPGE